MLRASLGLVLVASGAAWSQTCPTGATIPNFRFVTSTHTVPRMVTYAWDAPEGAPSGTTYEVLRAVATDYCSGFPAFTVLAETTALTYTATLDTPDRVYEFWVRVKGCDVAAPGVWVDDSFLTPPSAPILAVAGSSTNQVTLTVTQNDSRTAAQVIERAGPSGVFTQVDTRFFNETCPEGSAQTLVDSGLPAGTYTYRAFALNQGSRSQVFSNTVTANVGGGGEPAPTITLFAAGPASVGAGQASTLTWFTTGATSASIDQGIGAVPISGSIVVHPNFTTTYTLTVIGPGGIRTSRVQVNVAPSPSAGIAAATLVTVVSAPGLNGAFYRTSVQLTNPSGSLAVGRLVFHPKERSGSLGDSFIRYTLQPYQTLEFGDILAVIGTAGNGALDVVPESGGVPTVRARVYNDEGHFGTTGVFEDALPPSDALAAGGTAVLLAPPDFDRFRLSIGLFTLPSGATIKLTLRNAQGEVLRQVTPSYAGTFYIQRLAQQLFPGTPLVGNESITVEVLAGAAFVYATIADNITNDPAIQFARRLP